ncbi:hypothetical protein DFR50_10152 [Roseiarcus fermentans]|uniref:5-deoxyglucuronate isomerase n=1 Tax=Roseiarcus fermentans TaxID=1473586 RepID=A0A366FVP5_9HYPH|nr:hypothetical protein [Roseiarcus fermentans]RBP18110.1 hypothetical protein DFR50_10152 [Roseiarcus fermentans]
MYDKSDPRASLVAAPVAKSPVTAYGAADYLRFHEGPPQQSDALQRTWLGRGQNAVVAYSDVEAGAVFERRGQVDEWALLLPDRDGKAELVVGDATHALPGASLTFVPPGDSVLKVLQGGRIVRLFTTRSADLADASVNAAGYREPRPNVAPFAAWPAPPDGFRVRTYGLDVPDEPGRFGRIWRCTTLMVNILPVSRGPRDVTKLSPHHHDDFEQYSLVLEGVFIHHMRWPWTPDMTMWRNDEHESCGTPSVAVIPPPAIHTSRSLDPGVNQLVDIFSPPRLDFSLKPGWVLNAADYPTPAGPQGGA